MSHLSIKSVAIPSEQQAIRDKCFHPSGTFVEFPMADIETSIPARFEKIVHLYPGRLAIKDGHRTLTYQDLNQLANRVARAILRECSENRRPGPDSFRPKLVTPYVAPRTSVESELTRIWAEVLAVDPVGIHDNFFELGGHSLAAMRVVSRVIQSNQLDLPLRALLDAPTVADMARVIVQNAARRASANDLEQILSDIEAMSEQEARSLLARKKLLTDERV